MRKPIIAIDGFSSTGKSSISKLVADRLELIHVDTGALYRGVTYFALNNFATKDNFIDLPSLFLNLDKINLEFRQENGALSLYLNNKNIDSEIRKAAISDNVSLIAKQKEIRDFLLKLQQNFGEKGGIIVDGRDIATVIFPNADFKFFLTATKEERAKRRYLELISLGFEITIEEVLQNLIKRDKIDSEREIAPLKKADDAMLIDNTNLTKEETVALICSIIIKKK
ncbi:(d)CMP kinase [Frigoriflavimonas asaccharolytica]|uniref:Cytidylate kinase n=1 Tax=Frigoriflavimonas asaccharolytica TaxID=2735899 RepID=A0A8J8G9H8_9FLAO|nr:(d)CMP kinase [Frigoriflavimonas asaccharolytica]NRS93140.1 cytidylate kinase [Frigoriflavimonas asaccharolytica]